MGCAEEAQAGIATKRREVVCRVMSATARPDSSMDQFVDALEGWDARREGRIAGTWRDLVSNDDRRVAPDPRAPEAAGEVRLMDQEPAHDGFSAGS